MRYQYTNTIRIRLDSLLGKYPLIWQIIKFGLIGTFNFVVDLSIYLLLTRQLFLYYILAHIIAFLIANSLSFILNKRVAFKDKENRKIFIKYLKFLSFTIISLFISGLVLFVSVNYLKINDIYGETIKNIDIFGKEDQFVIDISEMKRGVYIATSIIITKN